MIYTKKRLHAFSLLLDEVRKQHPEESHDEHIHRSAYRMNALHGNWGKRAALIAAWIALTLILAAIAAKGQTTDTNVSRTGGVSVPANGQLPVSVSNTPHVIVDSGAGISGVTLLNAQAATGSLTGAAVTIPGVSAVGTLYVTFASITGSPSGCSVQLVNYDSLGDSINNGSANSVTAANGVTAFSISPNANLVTASQMSATFSCSVYPSTGTISVSFIPATATDRKVSGPDAQATTQTQGPVVQGGLNYSDGKIYAFAVDPATKGMVLSLPQQSFLNTQMFSDVTPASPLRGDLITSQGAMPKWTRFAKGAINQCVSMDGTATEVAWQPCYNAASTYMGTGAVPSNAATGILFASLNATQGILELGSDTLGIIKRNTNQYIFSVDGLVTSPWILDATSGFTTTLNISSSSKITGKEIESVLEADKNNMVGDGATDNTANFNSLISLACAGGYRTIYFPQGNYLFNSKPNNIGCGLILEGPLSGGSEYGWGAFFTANYNAASATDGFITWDGANSNTQGNGGGIWGINILVSAGKTAGAMVKLTGASCTARAGFNLFFDMKVGGGGGGNSSYGILVDGGNCTTAGTQGLRDLWVSSVYTFNTTVAAIKCINCVHFYAANLATSPGTGVGDIIVTGNGTGTQASTDVALSAVSITGNLTIDFATQVVYYGVVTGTASCTANTTTTQLYGDIGTVSGCTGFMVNDPNGNASLTGNLRATGFINKTGQDAIVAASSAINTTETVITKTAALAANRLAAKTTIKAILIGTCTSTVANASTITIRWGTNGTTADTAVATATMGAAAASGTTIPFRIEIELTVRVAGASATSSASVTLINQGVTGISTQATQVVLPTTSAFNTTTASGIMSFTYKSAATTTTSTFQIAYIEFPYN